MCEKHIKRLENFIKLKEKTSSREFSTQCWKTQSTCTNIRCTELFAEFKACAFFWMSKNLASEQIVLGQLVRVETLSDLQSRGNFQNIWVRNTDSRILLRLKNGVELASEIEIATLACSTLTRRAGRPWAQCYRVQSLIALRTVKDIWYLFFTCFFWWRNLLTTFEKATQNVTKNKNAKCSGGWFYCKIKKFCSK